jgi:hypothetical protein
MFYFYSGLTFVTFRLTDEGLVLLLPLFVAPLRFHPGVAVVRLPLFCHDPCRDPTSVFPVDIQLSGVFELLQVFFAVRLVVSVGY